ncbi:PilZ domain protein [Thiorhodovibrio winogradskyi]|uniref:PilZ domain protein n=1 Tax=Thiorhodovibrio winogradskyi TaxID=77007 RepID=A0ABZ0S4Z2_9GAMM|nr:PilZ domain-containing protein [Thiorhodovibrio winogradskyi]
MDERRQQPRFRCKLRTGVLFPDGHTELLWAEDISHNGLSIHADKPQRVGVPLRVLVFMFNHRHGKNVQAEAATRVASCVLDTRTQDFRLGLIVDEFIGAAESMFRAQIDYLAAPLAIETKIQYSEQPRMPQCLSFPLHRRIKLALADGGNLTGWTEDVTPQQMRIALSQKLEHDSVHHLKIPVVLAEEPDIFSVQAKARVKGVIFRTMGAFATHFSVFDYQADGLTLLRKELRERFPEIAQETTALTDNSSQPAREEDTEALPSLDELGLF